jgi:multiple sugar transport system substrate-binding protein
VNLDDIKSPLPPRKVPEKLIEKEKPINFDLNEIAQRQNETKKIETPKKNFGGKYTNLVMIVLGILIFILIVILIIKPKQSKNEEIVTLNYWGVEKNEEIMNGIISDFEAKNPSIKINYKKNQISNYRTRLTSRLLKTESFDDEDIDIFRIHNTWIPMFRDYLKPVPSEKVTSIGLETDFFGVYSKDLKENGKWLSIPLMYDGLALFYNKDLLEKEKIEIPRSWWDFNEAAFKLTIKDEKQIIQIAGAGIGTVDGNIEHWSDILGIMMKQNGINFAKKINMGQNLEDALKYYASFSKKEQSVWDNTLPRTTELFAKGKLAFYFGNSSRISELAILNKDLNYGITTIPQLPVTGDITDTQLTNIHWTSYWTEGVNNKSKHQEEAWKFLEYLSSKEVLEKIYLAESQVKGWGEIYPRKSMIDELKNNLKLWPFVSVADNAESWYLASNTGDDGVNSEMQKYFAEAIKSLNSYSSNAETMVTLKNGISQLQQKYSLKK